MRVSRQVVVLLAIVAAGLAPGTGLSATAIPADVAKFRIVTGTGPVATNSLFGISAVFSRHFGPVRTAIEVRRGDRWVRLGAGTIDRNRPLSLRIDRPGTTVIRLAYGPGLRLVTATTSIRVFRPGSERVVAGPNPLQVAATGRDLWVVGNAQTGRGELRLLDARTGRLRRGPIALSASGSSYALLANGDHTLIRRYSSPLVLRVLDPNARGLLGSTVNVVGARCDSVCIPTQLQEGSLTRDFVGGNPFTGNGVLGPDSQFWLTTPDASVPAREFSDGSHKVIQRSDRGVGPHVERGNIGEMTGHGGRSGELLAVRGGLWVRNANSQVRWIDSAQGEPILKGSFDTLARHSRGVWALRANLGEARPVIALLRRGPGANRPTIDVGPAYLEDSLTLAVSGSTAWLVAPFERTLIRVPLPR